MTTMPKIGALALHALAHVLFGKPVSTFPGRALRIVALAIGLLPLGMPLVASAASDDEKQFAFGVVERNATAMAKIGDSLYYFAELGMQEFESTKLMKEVLEAGGFTVELGAAGMPTNLWAHWGSGRPAIAIVTEIDALPEGSQTPMELARKPLVAGAPGHMEGHNTHGGLAAPMAGSPPPRPLRSRRR